MTLATRITIGLLSIVWSPLTVSQVVLEPIGAASAVIKAIGFEVAPPKGEFWFFYRNHPPGQVTFRKQNSPKSAGGDGATVIVEIKAEIYRQHDLRSAAGLKAALEYAIYEDPSQFKYLPPQMEPFSWQGTDCIRYSISREEPHGNNAETKTFVWDARGYFCRHPSMPTVGVMAFIQERRASDRPSVIDDDLRLEGEEVLKSVRFLKLK